MGNTLPSLIGAGPERTFADDATEEAFRRDGFVIVPFLSPDEVAWALRLREETATDDDFGLTVDYLRPDRTAMRRIREATAELWARHLPRVFADHRPIFTTFVVKHEGDLSEMFLHEDRTWVDERRYRSGTLWVPLVDVGPDIPNGGLQLIPGTHRLGTSWSGTGTPDSIRPFEATLRRHAITPRVPAGHAVFYDSRTLHSSDPNRTPDPRPALVCGIAPRQAALFHVRAAGRRRRVVFTVDEDFFVEHSPRELVDGMPEGSCLVEEAVDDSVLDGAFVAEVLGLDDPVAAEPVVPWDVRVAAGDLASGGRRVVARASVRDADIDEALLRPAGAPEGITFEVWNGRAGWCAVADREVRCALVLWAGARCLVHVEPRVELCWTVQDGPHVAAGVIGPAGVAQLEPGDVVVSRAEGTLLVFNDGPGLLVLADGGEL